MTKEKITLWAPAKVNLSLSVGARRADGYHEIRSVMQKVALYDTLTFSVSDRTSFSSDVKYLPSDERNLCVRAAETYFDAAGVRGGVEIFARKSIPIGSGLGGGSADAAATLRALCRLYGPLPEDVLFELALKLGADVAFCLSTDTTSLCEGIGEKLTSLSHGFVRKPCLLLVKNERKLSTASVYGDFDARENGEMLSDDTLIAAIKAGDFDGLCSSLSNMLAPVVLAHKPALADWMARLQECGARGVSMSGAGPTVFGVFESDEAALLAAKNFPDVEFCRVASFL